MTKQTRSAFIKAHWLEILLSFSLPILIMGLAYAKLGIYWDSGRSMLASDSYAQYVNFHASFANVLRGEQNIFYTWSGSLGLNYWALMGYYLNGLFTPLVFFFDNLDMPNALYLLTLLKLGFGGLSFWVFANATYRLNRWIKLGLSLSYALMAFTVSYSIIIMWLDVFIYLPLVILGIHRVMDQRKPTVLFISYLLLFVSNFYLAFMVGFFSVLYVIARTLTDWSRYKKQLLPYFITSFLAGGASMITILPTVMDLRSNGEGLTPLYTWRTPYVESWDLVAKNLVGMYDTTKHSTMPFVYIGLVPLLFALFYFISHRIPLKNKLLYGSLLLFLMTSFYLYPFNLFWHGFHAPNMFHFRFSFLFSFLILLLAGYGLEQLTKEESNRFVNEVLVVGGVFLAFFFLSNKKRYGGVTTASLLVTFVLLAVYLGLVLTWLSKPAWRQRLTILLLVIMGGEIGYNTLNMVRGIANEWSYPATAYYTTGHEEIQALTDLANEQSKDFFRLENLDEITMNDSFNFGYHGVSMFSSIRNRHSSQFVHQLGYRSLDTNLQVSYKNNTLMADSLIGMRYNIAKDDPQKFGYTKIGEAGDYQLYENQYALPLAMATDEGIYEESVANNQTEILNYLSGNTAELVGIQEAVLIDAKNAVITDNEDGTISVGAKEPNQAKELRWLVTVPAKTQSYLSLVTTAFQSVNVTVTVGNHSEESNMALDGQYHNLGYYDEATTVEVTALFDSEKAPNITLYTPDVLFIDTEKYAEVVAKAQEKGVAVQTDGRRATAAVDFSTDQVLLTTIPYDKGWKAYIDGEEVPINDFKEAFLSVGVPAGTHTVTFVFLPQGFAIGAVLSVSCLLLFIGFVYWLKRPKRRQTINESTMD